MLSQAYYVIINLGVIAPGYSREVVDFLNATEKMFLLCLMETMKLPSEK